jgi:hypothetical protein
MPPISICIAWFVGDGPRVDKRDAPHRVGIAALDVGRCSNLNGDSLCASQLRCTRRAGEATHSRVPRRPDERKRCEEREDSDAAGRRHHRHGGCFVLLTGDRLGKPHRQLHRTPLQPQNAASAPAGRRARQATLGASGLGRTARTVLAVFRMCALPQPRRLCWSAMAAAGMPRAAAPRPR